MIDFIKKSVTLAFAVVTVIFTFVPESFFGDCDWISQDFLKQCKLFSDLDATDVNIVHFSSCVLCACLDCSVGDICAFSEVPPMDYNSR